MARIVMKFGGTSVADLDRIKNVARRVKAEVDNGNEVAVVVSAMAGVTNQLVGYCQSLSPLFDAREYDAVVATGEQVTAGLVAIALQELGQEARSWQGWQVAVETNGEHGKARIESIEGEELIERMKLGQVPVVAGFQGIGPDNRVTTLGRGGSDTSAVALAAALKADQCDIYTDVDGIYTTDPRIVPNAKKLSKITYEEMLELASVGAKVLQTRSVELAVTGLDAGSEVIAAARAHAEGQGLNLTYRQGTAEDLAAEGAKFQVVTALEIIEHVADPAAFLVSLRALLAPGGLLFLSTLNRTAKSYAVAKIGAEYILRLLPVGTHEWKKFITPVELGGLCRAAGLRLTDTAGLSYSPVQVGFKVSRDLSVNYRAMAVAD